MDTEGELPDGQDGKTVRQASDSPPTRPSGFIRKVILWAFQSRIPRQQEPGAEDITAKAQSDVRNDDLKQGTTMGADVRNAIMKALEFLSVILFGLAGYFITTPYKHIALMFLYFTLLDFTAIVYLILTPSLKNDFIQYQHHVRVSFVTWVLAITSACFYFYYSLTGKIMNKPKIVIYSVYVVLCLLLFMAARYIETRITKLTALPTTGNTPNPSLSATPVPRVSQTPTPLPVPQVSPSITQPGNLQNKPEQQPNKSTSSDDGTELLEPALPSTESLVPAADLSLPEQQEEERHLRYILKEDSDLRQIELLSQVSEVEYKDRRIQVTENTDYTPNLNGPQKAIPEYSCASERLPNKDVQVGSNLADFLREPSVSEINKLLELAEQCLINENHEGALKLFLQAGLKVVKHDWSFITGGKIRSLDCYDINRDGATEILVGSEDGNIYVLDDDGTEVWHFKTSGWVQGVTTCDVDFDGNCEVIGGSDKIYILDKSGNLKTSFPVSIHSSVTSLCSLQKGPRATVRILSGHDDGSIICWNTSGESLWRYKCNKRVICMLAEDVDQDGHIEIIAGTEDKQVYIFTEQGVLKDIFRSDHWILNIAKADLFDEGQQRLLIASFEGSVHIYRYAKAATLNIQQHGILGLALAQLSPEQGKYHVILGSSDRAVSIVNVEGEIVWRFNTSYGHRVIQAWYNDEKQGCQLIVGAEDGLLHSYTVKVPLGLAKAIRSTYEKIYLNRLSRLGLSAEEQQLLANFVSVDLINQQANLFTVQRCKESGDLESAAESAIEIWRNSVEFRWVKKTGGRVYALTIMEKTNPRGVYVMAGSEDGQAYALQSRDGSVAWSFKASGAVRGIDTKNCLDPAVYSIVIGSVDGNVYMLSDAGQAIWNFQSQDWVLYTKIGCRGVFPEPKVIFGSDAHYFAATTIDGQLIWKFLTGDRVRALVLSDVDNDGFTEIVAGSDDQFVYIVSEEGFLKHKFRAPHWILVIDANDIDNDGKVEILVGTEDGYMYVYTSDGQLKWKYRTGHWIAALHSYTNSLSGESLIVIGSADRFVYCLDGFGRLLWKLETGARVRTIMILDVDEDGNQEVLFGSYDHGVYMFSVVNKQQLSQVLTDVFTAIKQSWPEGLHQHQCAAIRALFFLHCTDVLLLSDALDQAEPPIVKAAAISSLTSAGQLDSEPIQRLVARCLLHDDFSWISSVLARCILSLSNLAVSVTLLRMMIEFSQTTSDFIKVIEYVRLVWFTVQSNDKLRSEIIEILQATSNPLILRELTSLM